MSRRSGIPGMHGVKRMGKLTEYAKQLREKQKTKRIFGLSEKQFRRTFDKAMRSSGITGDVLLQLLERRLDNALFRGGFALTRMQARQFAGHGLFLLNGRRVDVPSMLLQVGDKLEVRGKSKNSEVFKKNFDELEKYDSPSWLKVDRKKMTIEVIALPDNMHFEQAVVPQMIVEFYSR
jgi:small subunit ribosomal protein S4